MQSRKALSAASQLAQNATREAIALGLSSMAGLYAEWLFKIERASCLMYGVKFPDDGGAQ